MSAVDRIWIAIGAVLAFLFSTLGALPQMQALPFPLTGFWPIAGLWAALAWSGLGMSVWAALCLVCVGVGQDFLHDAPLGAWPLALLGAYGVGLVAPRLTQVGVSLVAAETLALVGGILAAALLLAMAGDIAGGADVIDFQFWGDLVLTGGLYFVVQPLFAPRRKDGAVS